MNNLDLLQKFLSDKLQNLLVIDSVWQLAVLLIVFVIAWKLNRQWSKRLTAHLGEKEQRGVSRFLLRGSSYLIFPIITLLFIYIGVIGLRFYNIATPIVDIVIPLLLSLAIIRVTVYSLRRAFTKTQNLRAWEGFISISIWGLVALHLLGWLPDILNTLDSAAMTFGDNRVSILSVAKFIIIAGIYIVAARWLSMLIEQRAKRSKVISSSMQVGLSKFSTVILYSIAIIVALNSVGIDLTTLTVFGGAIGVGLGFGLQRIASNFISGFILLFDRSIKPGDVISIGNRFGWVVALHARYIVVKDRDGVETLIPNENIITSEVTNWSYSDKHVRVKVPVQVSYDDDVEQAMQLMLDACNVSPRVLQKPEPTVRLTSFADSGIELELRLWLDDPEQGVGSVKSDINLAIWKAFKENAITIPFPQRDVHLIKDTLTD
ncbi:Potassium efflux system KefA protein / Small-conductance mechanosensitive channel [hydrothermal vent metagenome]|uniref:Potassium efflux system KefA protein / Small-conductance mechanosensitive channel n=1 Tax=hydrothermal vent metagenome TaxID=652676 RepID=A0A3B0ZLE2_9ZZZZ